MEEVQVQEVGLADAKASAAEVIMSLRGAREEVEQILSLLSDEETVVEGLIEALTSSDLPVNRIPLEPSAMPEELGEVEAAHLTSEGSLIVSLMDEEVISFDLSLEENRGLLVSALGDLVPKLHGVLDGTIVLPELAVEEEPMEDEPTEEETPPEEIEEPIEEAVVEPDADETIEEEITEPTIEEDVAETPIPEEDEVGEPAIEEQEFEEFTLPEFEPDAEVIEAPDAAREEAAPPEKPVKPPLARDAQVKRLRKAVRRQRSYAQIEMDKVRRQREAQIRRLRVTNGMMIQYGEQEEGLLGKVKRLLSKRRRRR